MKLAVFSTGPAIRNTAANLITEIVGTFMLVFGILAIVPQVFAADLATGGWSETGALPVGLLVLVIGLSLGGPTGYAINPARDLGPRASCTRSCRSPARAVPTGPIHGSRSSGRSSAACSARWRPTRSSVGDGRRGGP